MGVTGAALATLAAEIVSAVAFTRIMLKQGLIRWSKLFKLPRWSTLKPLLQGGAALQLRNLALNITFLSVARVTQSIDNTGVSAAAHSIALQVFQVGGIVLLALSTVAQSLVPNEMVVKIDPKTGKRSGGRKAARALVNRMMSLGFLLGAALGALQILILPMIHKFTPLKEVQEAARLPSYIASFLQIINGLVSIMQFSLQEMCAPLSYSLPKPIFDRLTRKGIHWRGCHDRMREFFDTFIFNCCCHMWYIDSLEGVPPEIWCGRCLDGFRGFQRIAITWRNCPSNTNCTHSQQKLGQNKIECKKIILNTHIVLFISIHCLKSRVELCIISKIKNVICAFCSSWFANSFPP